MLLTPTEMQQTEDAAFAAGAEAEALMDRALCESVGFDAGEVDRLWRAFRSDAPGIYWSRIWAVCVLLWWSRTHGMSLE